MTSSVIKKNPDEIEVYDNTIRAKSQNFLTLLHRNPNPKELRSNPAAKNSKYLPISFLEMQLDEMFFGLWQTVNFTYQTIANELVGSIELRFFHPVTKE